MPEPITSLYVHVPFCAQKCSYCAFYSEASSGALMARYTEALILELERMAGDLQPRTIFFGGGTPSILNLTQWRKILSAMEDLGLADAVEWTVECNPATVSLDKAKLLRDYGVNRISMGVQSLEPALLDRLGRIHSREMVFSSFEILRRAGFDNINLDLMFAIPGQTMEDWGRTLESAIALGSEHLSSYEVIYEEDTPLYEQLKAGKAVINEELACDMYDRLLETAAAHGLAQYEVANFARPGRACAHNLNYWRGGSYYATGPSAAGYVRGVRTKNVANTQIYCDRIEQGLSAIDSTEELSPVARAGETAAFGIRMVEGVRFDEFERLTGHNLKMEWSAEMKELIHKGWGRLDSSSFGLTPLGLRFADSAAEFFLR
jgi:oxygen-independent coproporphyrinogen-3 oxidase